ncbi:MAG: efflux RND transporter permease subunit [Acidobacteria bacterium]|nr:efflux RND transporter permease subunit [Acidobacteriota bacterium]
MSETSQLRAAGKLAAAFIQSKLTPLFVAASVLLGVLAVVKLPREEEPQIIVPMIDIFVEMPGATAREIEERVTKPMEKLLWEIPGVEYIYSTSSPGASLAVVRFFVGEDEEKSIVRLNQKMFANFDLIPPGCSQPLIKPRSIDDVPILALTLWSKRYGDFELRRLAAQLHDTIKQVDQVSAVAIIGGQRRQVRVELDEARLAGYHLSPQDVAGALGLANRRLPAGSFSASNREFILEAGSFLSSAEEVRRVVAGVSSGRPVFLGDVARVEDGGEEPSQYVRFGASWPAVTLAISKRKGANAIAVAERVLARVETARGSLLPADVELAITRNYGETAAEKSNELLFHMLIAVVSVSVLIWFTLGFRESWIVFTAIPVTLALTLATFYLYGFTLNRITLFALIFSIGILVDDAIVIVENIVRHARMPHNQGRDRAQVAVEAVDEVGNPTILATLTVIAAILPMAFAGGLMGPYMRPIPIGASAAMVFSLLVALVVTPWAAIRMLGDTAAHGHSETENRITRLYRAVMGPLLHRPLARYGFLMLVAVLLVGSMGLVYIGFVKVKMLPFDNKSEFQVIVDMPEGTTLEETGRVTGELAAVIRKQPEVTNFQTYVGTASPYNFNGLVRHYFLRRGPNVADIQVNLVGKSERRLQSHEIAKRVREQLAPVAARFGARIKVAEVPPGPPVLETMVAEVYGPSQRGQIEIARMVRDIFEKTPGVVDVDWYVEDDQTKYSVRLDREKAALNGVSDQDVAGVLKMAAAGEVVGLLHAAREKEDVPITVRLARASRSDIERLKNLKLRGRAGNLVALGEVARIDRTTEDKSIYHKNLMPVTYVTADLAGAIESPVYAMLNVGPEIGRLKSPEGYQIEQYTASLPPTDTRYALKWDGEWHITYEVFRDLGLAFAAVLVLIYILIVGWFQSFVTPLVIMAAIPFSLVGILPAHGLLRAFFTATSMIGFITGAGIVVRNSIILVDFIELRLKEGMPLDQAVIDAGAVRFRPMMLTAAAVIVGSAVILFDPIFQGLAIALMAGEIASLALSRMTVPVVYFMVNRRRNP